MTLYLPTAPFQDKWVYNNDISNKCKFNKHLLNAYYVPEITQDTENIVVNKAKKTSRSNRTYSAVGELDHKYINRQCHYRLW